MLHPLVALLCVYLFCSFLFTDPSPTDIYTLSLHDALPISLMGEFPKHARVVYCDPQPKGGYCVGIQFEGHTIRSEEHTSELQSLRHLVCRLLLEKKKKQKKT